MGTQPMNEERLLEALHSLPRERAQARDLGPAIAARLDERAQPQRRRWLVPAMAAALVSAFVAGVVFERQQVDIAPVMAEAELQQQPWLDLSAALEASEREYQAAFLAFVPVGREASLLDAQSVDDIENSWVQFRQAEASLLVALREHPGNAFLAEQLLGLRARQLDFMQKLYTLDQNSRRDI
jgi:hypothetical protein